MPVNRAVYIPLYDDHALFPPVAHLVSAARPVRRRDPGRDAVPVGSALQRLPADDVVVQATFTTGQPQDAEISTMPIPGDYHVATYPLMDDGGQVVAVVEYVRDVTEQKAMQRQMDVLDVIKSDLMRQNKRDESIKLAHYIQKSMVSNLNDDHKYILDLGVRQALFYVLFGARMPSVLVEVSFISNPEDEKLLSKDYYRTQIAEAIAAGLNKYITSIPTVQKVVEIRSNNLHYR